MDYEEIFAPVSKLVTMHTLITITLVRQWSIFKMDVKITFFIEDLQEQVYMVLPPRVTHNPGEVYRPKKTLYGLKQAPQAWLDKFSIVIASIGFSL